MAAEASQSGTREADNLDATLFTELISTCTINGRKHTFTPSQAPNQPKYFLKLRNGLHPSKPDLELHLGIEDTGPVIGCAKLRLNSSEMCIGDYERLMQEGDAQGERCFWEKVEKQKEWGRYGIYEFGYGDGGNGVGSQGVRIKYTWRRSVSGWAKTPKEWELRVGGRELEGGELLAVWKRRSMWKSVKQGSLWVNGGFEGEERKKWEIAVVLSLMTILEGYVRRQ